MSSDVTWCSQAWQKNLKAEVWGENPLALKPEMWASLDDVQKAEPGWSHLSTFGYGGKGCIGQRCVVSQHTYSLC
jgi:hypothetical protein